ncbi:MAG: hypothetical protein U1F27_12805 [Turneriella sp.]
MAFFQPTAKGVLAAIFGGKNDGDGAGRTVMVDLEQNKIAHTIIRAAPAARGATQDRDGFICRFRHDAQQSVFYHAERKSCRDKGIQQDPNTIAESNDGKYLYVSCRGKNNPKSYLIKGPDFGRLMVIDIATQQVVEEIEAGNQPADKRLARRQYIVLTDFLDHAMRVYERVR